MAAVGGFPGQDRTRELDVYLAGMSARVFRPVGGETVDNEGFAIITNAATMREGHVGAQAVLWMPGRSFASSVSMTVQADGSATVHRDGKGDVLTFSLPEAGGVPVVVQESGVDVRLLWLNTDGETGLYTSLNGDPACDVPFASLVEGVIRLASDLLI